MKVQSTVSRLDLPTSWGVIRVLAKGGKIVSCNLPTLENSPSIPLCLTDKALVRARPTDRDVLDTAAVFIAACLNGATAKCPPLEEGDGGPFTRRARAAIRRIRPGQTRTYSEIAVAAGSPLASRAAGTACATNPLPLFIPCHRVVTASGALGGYSGGLAWKRVLLDREKK